MAASTFNASIAVISLIDAERQWFTSLHGVDFRETPVAMSFSAHAIAERRRPCLVVGDAAADPRFSGNPAVTGEPHVKLYTGAPIIVHGQRLGALAVAAADPREQVDPAQLEQLVAMADTAAALFELKGEARVRARTAAELIREKWRHALTLEAGKILDSQVTLEYPPTGVEARIVLPLA